VFAFLVENNEDDCDDSVRRTVVCIFLDIHFIHKRLGALRAKRLSLLFARTKEEPKQKTKNSVSGIPTPGGRPSKKYTVSPVSVASSKHRLQSSVKSFVLLFVIEIFPSIFIMSVNQIPG
jgi:hypothetical protein